MLVLSRKQNQSIKIGDDIELTVVSVEGDQVKLGINAPKNVEIHRKEVYLAIQEENASAASSSIDVLTAFAKNDSSH
ncbi:carbon storage regulator CsrA [Bacillus daqingensis]|uniref:Translational regulator CsrA n=2 Tax=Bacillaceae TaxID=186817 RepID=A0A969TUH2_9BACI|nr:carbon storage regulator CsrA [Alkalicoccus luteus]NJP37057.1 carbon storage regulator CsrA [Alkalicoccus luteus]